MFWVVTPKEPAPGGPLGRAQVGTLKNSKNILRVSKNYETWGFILFYGAKDCCKKSRENSISRSLKKKLSFEKKVCLFVVEQKKPKLLL